MYYYIFYEISSNPNPIPTNAVCFRGAISLSLTRILLYNIDLRYYSSIIMAYSGYLFELSDSGLSGSGHLALSSLLESPNLDIIGSPYQYEYGPRAVPVRV